MRKLMLAGALLALVAGNASAASFVVDSNNCATVQGGGNCYGLMYTLTIDASPGPYAYTASLRIEDDPTLTGYYDFAAMGISFISAVDFKGATGLTGFALTAAPGGIADWTTTENKSSNSGCEAQGNGFLCSEDLPAVTLAPVSTLTGGGNFLWIWDFNSDAAPTLAHIGAKFDNAAGTLNGMLLSAALPGDGGGGDGEGGGGDGEGGGGDGEGGTQAPEPVMLALFGLALAGGASRLRKRVR